MARYRIIYDESYISDCFVDTIDEVKEEVYVADRYREYNYESLEDSLNECNSGWEFNGTSWSASELLNAIDEDAMSEWIQQEAEYCVTENLPYEYDSDLENMDPGDRVQIPEVGIVVEMVSDEEEDGEEDLEMVSEAMNLL